MIDLRSDTVTRPTAAMRRAMAEAEVGDDHYGEDPTVNRLQEEAARLLGFEAALFVPTGTMGNEIAIRLLTEPGQQVLAEERSHVVEYELSGMAVLSGVVPKVLRAPDGILTPEVVRSALRPPTVNRAAATLLVVENTHNLAGGAVDFRRGDAGAHRLRPRGRPARPSRRRPALARRRGPRRAAG